MNKRTHGPTHANSTDRRTAVRAGLAHAALLRAMEELKPYADAPGVAAVLVAISESRLSSAQVPAILPHPELPDHAEAKVIPLVRKMPGAP